MYSLAMRSAAWIVRLGMISAAASQELALVDVHPQPRVITAPADTSVVLRFDREIDRGSIRLSSSFTVIARWSGPVDGSLSFSDGDQTVTLTPDRRLSAGEIVNVYLSNEIRGADGSTFPGFSYQFWTAAAAASMRFAPVQTLTTRDQPAISSRAYGGVATDLDHDGYLDLTIVNEDTADLRVYMSLGDRSARYREAFAGPYAVGNRASPSEPSDFDRDGNVDITVGNINDNTVSVLLGTGRGGYRGQRSTGVGAAPRGIAVVDFDRDGDIDIVNTNAGDGTLSLLTNDGGGSFGPPRTIDSGGDAEWALASADMTGDGILDLIVGARGSEESLVLAGDGAGGFTLASRTSGVGDVWMLVVGDVNSDQNEDVAAVANRAAQAVVLVGDGQGNLAAPAIYPIDVGGLAVDLGDLDGDGDLDMITSSFSGDWFMFANDGAGQFTVGEIFVSPVAASCAIVYDADNDGDLDIALIDEIADELIIMRNVPR